MPPPADDDKTLAVPSAALLDEGPGGKDALDDERTQKVAFDPGDLGAALDGIEDAALSLSSTPRPNAGPMFAPRPHAGKPTVAEPKQAGPSAPAARPVPPSGAPSVQTSSAPPARASVAAGIASPGEITAKSRTPSAAGKRSSRASRRSPPPPWVVGYLVTCLVLTLMGLAILWLEYRSFGRLLP